jgi:hypothetical protein
MGRPNQEVRWLLTLLGRPDKLEHLPLAVQLKSTLGTATAREAVLQVLDNAFSVRTPLNDMLRRAIFSCDLDGNKTASAATMLNVSARTLFRRRSEAIAVVAAAVDQILHHTDSESEFKHVIARMIAPIESSTSVHLLESSGATIGPSAAYEAICSTVRNGRDVSDALLHQCSGHWRLLAMVEIARANLYRGRSAVFESMRAEIRKELDGVRGVEYDRVEFELAYAERLEALRRCDVDASGAATRRMMAKAGRDTQLVSLALVSQAEQACDEGDLQRADTVIRELQTLCARMQEYRTTARTSHVTGTLHFLSGRYESTIDLCTATAAALAQVEPEFAACSAANAGRAALFLDRSWKRPLELCERFPQSYVTALVDSVWARHLATSDRALALSAADRALNTSTSLEAFGVAAYARATRSIILESLGRGEEAQAERVTAWQDAVRLRRAFYLHDLFCHPAIKDKGLGPFAIDEPFANAIGRRFLEAADGVVHDDDLDDWVTPALLVCLYAAREQSTDILQQHQRLFAARVARRAAIRMVGRDLATLLKASRLLAKDLGYCLTPAQRPAFVDRFGAAAARLWNREALFMESVAN